MFENSHKNDVMTLKTLTVKSCLKTVTKIVNIHSQREAKQAIDGVTYRGD